MRKSVAGLVRDTIGFALASSDLRAFPPDADPWLHPVDSNILLDDPDAHFAPFDAAGLPMQCFGSADPVYVPSRTAAFGLAHWNAWKLTGDSCHVAPFLACAEWFASFPEGAIRHDFPLLSLRPGWLSALAQGEALSMFARAFLLTNDERWLRASEAAASWLAVPVDQGGVLSMMADRGPFLEEYPGTQHGLVLNGCLYALVGWEEAVRVGLPDTSLRDHVANTVEGMLGGWERQGWSLYQWTAPGELGNYNTPSYQIVHIALLSHLGRLMKRSAYLAAAQRLRLGLAKPRLRARALIGKLTYRTKTGW